MLKSLDNWLETLKSREESFFKLMEIAPRESRLSNCDHELAEENTAQLRYLGTVTFESTRIVKGEEVFLKNPNVIAFVVQLRKDEEPVIMEQESLINYLNDYCLDCWLADFVTTDEYRIKLNHSKIEVYHILTLEPVNYKDSEFCIECNPYDLTTKTRKWHDALCKLKEKYQ